MNKIIEIPEGYEARIEGNKVILEPKESEDEKIRKGLENFLWCIANGGMNDRGTMPSAEMCQKWLAYLEKQAEQKPAEWSEEDENTLGDAITAVDLMLTDSFQDRHPNLFKAFLIARDFLKSLPERFNLQPKQESEPIEIKYAGKIYKVYGTKVLPGGVVGYIIEDEPGHYDCIIHPDEVLGGGYGSPYPTKEANFGQPHWKPSELQMKALLSKLPVVKGGGDKVQDILESLYDDLKKLL